MKAPPESPGSLLSALFSLTKDKTASSPTETKHLKQKAVHLSPQISQAWRPVSEVTFGSWHVLPPAVPLLRLFF